LMELMEISTTPGPDWWLSSILLTGAASLCSLAVVFFITGVFWKYDRLLLVLACTFSFCASIVFGYTVPWLVLLWGYYRLSGDGSEDDLMEWITLSAVIVWIAANLHGVVCMLFSESLRGWETAKSVLGDLSKPRRVCCKRSEVPHLGYMAKLRTLSILQMCLSCVLLLVGYLAHNSEEDMGNDIDSFSGSRMRTLLLIGAGVMMCSGLLNYFGNHEKGQERLHLAILLNFFIFGHSVRSALQIYSLYCKKDTFGFGYDSVVIDDSVFADLFQVTGCCYVVSAVLAMLSNIFSLFLKETLEDCCVFSSVERFQVDERVREPNMEDDFDEKALQPGMVHTGAACFEESTL